MATELYNRLINVFYLVFASKKRYTIEMFYCDKTTIKIFRDSDNEIIYENTFDTDKETYLILSNRLRSLFISYNALYSKLDNLDRENKIYHQQTIFAQNLRLIINMNSYNESFNAVKYHKEINCPKQKTNNHVKTKTIQQRVSVG